MQWDNNELGSLEKGKDYVRHSNIDFFVPKEGGESDSDTKLLIYKRTCRFSVLTSHCLSCHILAHNQIYS